MKQSWKKYSARKIMVEFIWEGKFCPSRLYICEELSTQRSYETHFFGKRNRAPGKSSSTCLS
jgi:hypothetical protein